MKSTSIFKKALIFAVVMVLSLVTVISVIPAFAADTDHGETLKASNISISGEITMLYYFTGLDSDGYDADRDYVRVTIPQREEGKYTVIDTKIDDLDQDNQDRWIVPVSVPYAQQTAEYTIQFFKNGVGGKVRTRTVKAYADTVLSLAAAGNTNYTALVEPIKNMLNAGAMAQLAFGYNTSNLANAELFPDANVNPVNGMLPEHFYDVEGEPTQTGDSTYIEFLGGQALLDSAVTLRIFVDCPDAVTSAQVSDGNVTKTVKLRVDDQGRKYVSINNIVSTSFNTRYEVSITYADATASYSYSVLDYAIDVLESSIVSPEMKNVARALYLFYAQTTKYVDDSYAPGPKDENGAPADCNHARSYTKDGNLVCPDCGHTEALANTTKLDVAIVGTPNIIADEDSTITLAFSINGTANSLSGVLFTPKCDGVTFTLVQDSIDYDSNKFTVTADNNLLVLENNGEALTGELVTATYTVNAPAGLHKIYIALREAADVNGNDIQVAGLVTGITTFEAKANDCGEDNHTLKYSNTSETHHKALCIVCGATSTEEHEFTEVTETENGIRTYKNACVCGNTKAFYVAKVLTTGTNEITLTANTASYSWVADNASSINIVCPELAVDYDLVLTNSNGTSVSMSADAHNGILSMYVLAGEVVDAKLVAQAGTTADLNVQVYAGAEGEDLGHNVGVGVSGIDGSCSGTIDADSVTLTHIDNASKAYLRFQITYPAANSAGRYMAITYKTTDLTSLPVQYYGVVDTNGTETSYGDTTKVNGQSYTLINDGDYHTIIIDTVAVMNAAHKTGYEMTKIRFSVSVDATSSAAFTLKSAERSDDLALLEAKYGPEYGTAENPKPIDSIASITTKLKAGDTDGYYYKWTANKTGFYSFTLPEDVAYDIVVTANGSTVSYAENAHNGYLSTFATAGSDIVVQVISTANGYPAVTATASSTFTDGSFGAALGEGTCINVSKYNEANYAATSTVSATEGVTFEITGSTGCAIAFAYPQGSNNGRYVAITYKSSANFPNGGTYHYWYDGTYGAKIQNKAHNFIHDNQWHTAIFDTYYYMGREDGSRATAFRIYFYSTAAVGETMTIKSIELSDDKAFLDAKYGPAYGTSENPKPIDSITNITANLKAGDTDGYYYQYTATKKGIYTFTKSEDVQVSVSNSGCQTIFENDDYLSVSVVEGDVLTINVKATDTQSAIKTDVKATYTNGSFGSNLAGNVGITIAPIDGSCSSTESNDTNGVTLTHVNGKTYYRFAIDCVTGHREGRYFAITYKATDLPSITAQYYGIIEDATGTETGYGDTTKVNGPSYTLINDGEYHTLIVDTQEILKAAHKSGYTMTKLRFTVGVASDSDAALTFKAVERSDDLAALQAKYAPAMGSKSNPEVLDSVSSINVNLKAGDTDGYYYQWTATETGVCTFVMPDGVDVSITNANYPINFDSNGYFSIYAKQGDVLVINAKASDNNYPAVTGTVSATFTDGAYGAALYDGTGIEITKYDEGNYAATYVDSTTEGRTIKSSGSSGCAIKFDYPTGNNDGRYIAITYKASANFPSSGTYYYWATKPNGESTGAVKIQNKTNIFTSDNQWHTLIFDTYYYMGLSDGSKATAFRIYFYSTTSIDATMTIKAIEFSDDISLLTAKYGGAAIGSPENPEIIKSIDSISTSLKAGDNDGYTYKYTAPKAGIYTFAIPENAALNAILTADGATVNSATDASNGYVSIFAKAGSEMTIQLVSAGDGYPAVEATVNGRHTYGSTGKYLAGGSGGDVTVYSGASYMTGSVSATEGVTYTAISASPQYLITLGNRTENERYMVITYKSNGIVDTSQYFFSYVQGETTQNYDQKTKISRAVTFVNDNNWNVIVIDTWAFMTGQANGATHNAMDGSYTMTGLRLDFRNVTSGSTFTVKGIELSNDVDYLEAKYGVSIGE